MLAFFLIWAPYGGPPEHVLLPEFGMNPAQLVARITDILGTCRITDLCNHDRDLIFHVRRARDRMPKRDGSPKALLRQAKLPLKHQQTSPSERRHMPLGLVGLGQTGDNMRKRCR